MNFKLEKKPKNLRILREELSLWRFHFFVRHGRMNRKSMSCRVTLEVLDV